ncbi:MAG: methionine--tRNA ligase [Simkaniaceae bacterium]|nr:methionine--tRNA ligase [Simkaniaceae bacterium]
MSEKVLITSALPYANGALHFGHIAGAYLPADVFARYSRLKGDDVAFICGSDEYGVAITLSAEIAGKTPQDHVDHFHKINQDLFKKLGISFDHYSRTTWEGHKKPVCEFFEDLNDRGYIEERTGEHLYSQQDNRFLADRYVVGTCPKCHADDARGDECQHCGASYEALDLENPRSKITNAPLTLKKSTHWYLRFDKFKEQLQDFIAKKPWKQNVLNFVENYIAELHPRAITRDSDWGIPVPLENAKKKVFYVWFDAPIGYISATQEWSEKSGDPTLWKKYWLDEKTKYVQFIGKDNIPFHAIFFPAMCMGQKQNYKLVDDLPANEFLNLEGKQFSKSSGWTIDLEQFFENFSSDQIRYYLAAIAPETSDSEFSWKDFQGKCNTDLLGKYGNFANRTLVFVRKVCGEAVPQPNKYDEVDQAFADKIVEITASIEKSYHTYSLRKASSHLMELATAGNVYFDMKKPWALAKDPTLKGELETTLYLCIDCLRVLARLASPLIPDAAQNLAAMLGYDAIPPTDSIPPGQNLSEPKILFQKIENGPIDTEVTKLESLKSQKSDTNVTYEEVAEMIDFDDFTKVDLRIAEVLKAEHVPKSDKLLKLTVDLGFEKRIIVSGIAKQFPILANLIGKRVAIVANLRPRKILGIESHGMLLSAAFQKNLELLSVDDIPPGHRIM